MAKFITAEELKNRNSITENVERKKLYELQHSIVEYRLNNCERHYIIVPTDLIADIKEELKKEAGYIVCHVPFIKKNDKVFSNGIYIGYKDTDSDSFFILTEDISWEYWAKIIGLNEN